MQAAVDCLMGSDRDFCLDQYRRNVLSPLGVRWEDYLRGWQQQQLTNWLEIPDSDSKWSLLCCGPPRCGKTTFAAALSDGLHLRFEDHKCGTAIVTLLLTPRHFPAEPSTDHVLSVILRAVLRQLFRQACLREDIGAHIDKLRTSVVAGLNLSVLVPLVADLLCFWKRSFLILDDIDDIPTVDIRSLRSRLVNLGFCSIVFVGSPFNTLTYGGEPRCDVHSCAQPSLSWVECEECDRCHCMKCYDEDQKRCCTAMAEPLPIAELRLELAVEKQQQFVEKQLRSVIDEGGTRMKFVERVVIDSSTCLAMTKLSVDNIIDNPDYDEIPAIRDRLSLSQKRFFNLALQRVKRQTSEQDRKLGLAVMALVALADFDYLSFAELKGALLLVPSSEDRFGLPLSRRRISLATRGWVNIHAQTEIPYKSPLVECFTPAAQTYLFEECPELFDCTSVYCGIPHGRDFAGFCLDAINERLITGAKKRLGLQPEVSFFEYAFSAWPRSYKRFSTYATNEAVCKFLERYGNDVELQKMHLWTWHNTRRSVSHGMLILAGHNLWEFISWFRPGDINVRDAITGWTPLMVAVEAGHEQFVRHLISRKANLSLTCKRGESALWLAIFHRNFELVRILVDSGGTNLLNAKNHEDQTPLMFAIQKHNESKIHRKPSEERPLRKILEFLASRPALAHEFEDIHGRLALHHAAALQDKEALDILLDRTACRSLVNRPENNKHERTALMNLTLGKCNRVSDAFDKMISCGASVNCIDSWKRTVLHYAAAKADAAPIVGKIMDKGGQIGAQDGAGRSPFHIAAIHGCDEVTKRLLLEATPGILGLRDNDDRTAWQLAKLCRNNNVADLIAKQTRLHGVRSREQEHRIETADGADTILEATSSKYSILKYQELHLAVQHGRQDRVIELLRRGTEVCNAVNIDGNTALHLALQLRELIIFGEIDLEMETMKGIIQELINHDQVDVSLRNHAHKTPLDILQAVGSDALLFAMMEKTWTTNTALEVMHTIPELHNKLQIALEAGERLLKPLTPKLLRILFSYGADVFRETTSNVSLHDFATSRGASKEVLDAITHEEERVGRILEEKEPALVGEGRLS